MATLIHPFIIYLSCRPAYAGPRWDWLIASIVLGPIRISWLYDALVRHRNSTLTASLLIHSEHYLEKACPFLLRDVYFRPYKVACVQTSLWEVLTSSRSASYTETKPRLPTTNHAKNTNALLCRNLEKIPASK